MYCCSWRNSKEISIKHLGMRGMVDLYYLLSLCAGGPASNRNSSAPLIAQGLSRPAPCYVCTGGTLLSVLPFLEVGQSIERLPASIGGCCKGVAMFVGWVGDVFGEQVKSKDTLKT